MLCYGSSLPTGQLTNGTACPEAYHNSTQVWLSKCKGK